MGELVLQLAIRPTCTIHDYSSGILTLDEQPKMTLKRHCYEHSEKGPNIDKHRK